MLRAGVDFLDLGHGPAALEMRCVAVTLDNSTFASITAANDSAVLYADADGTCLTQCRLTDSVKFANNEASIVLRIAGRRVSSGPLPTTPFTVPLLHQALHPGHYNSHP